MKKYYCVLSLTCTDGRASAAITDTVTAHKKPKDIRFGAGKIVVRTEWFESLEEAEHTVRETVVA